MKLLTDEELTEIKYRDIRLVPITKRADKDRRALLAHIEAINYELRCILNDAAKYPQLAIHANTVDRLQGLL